MKFDISSSQIATGDLLVIITELQDEPSPYSFNASDNEIDITGLSIITRLIPSLNSLSLAYNPIRIANDQDLAVFNTFCIAVANSNIQELDLSGLLGLGDSGFECLVNALLECNNSALTRLVLTNTGITGRSAENLQRLLADNHTLSSLILSKNQIPYAQRDILDTAFHRHPSLTELDLSHNFAASHCKFFQASRGGSSALESSSLTQEKACR